MRGFVLTLLAVGLAMGPAASAETVGEAITAFGLVGSWSIDCGKQPTAETCTRETGCGVRIIYEVSPTGSPRIRTLAGSFIPGQGIRTIEAVVESAERIGDDRIRIVSVQQGAPGQFTTAMWLRQPGEHWESILLKVGPKFRSLLTQDQDGTKITAKDGFVVQPPPGTKHDELPAAWITTDKPTPLFERCSD
jgi:hypothetical protein